jgi:hypothetical protein
MLGSSLEKVRLKTANVSCSNPGVELSLLSVPLICNVTFWLRHESVLLYSYEPPARCTRTSLTPHTQKDGSVGSLVPIKYPAEEQGLAV